MKAAILALAASVVAPAMAIPPPQFGFPEADNHTELSIAYSWAGNTTNVQEAQLFGSNITSQQPQLAIDPRKYKNLDEYDGSYIVIMVDPDAPSPDQPTSRFILHWLMTNVGSRRLAGSNSTLFGQRLLQQTSGRARVPYAPPAPPPSSAAHRYLVYAFAQPDNFTIPDAYAGYSASNRSGFNIDNFVKDAKLERPMAAQYFYVSRQSSVNGTFIALAGGEYPGGNGAAVFATDNGSTTNATTPTGSAVRMSPGVAGLLGAGVMGVMAML